jgi:hypothetical protein
MHFVLYCLALSTLQIHTVALLLALLDFDSCINHWATFCGLYCIPHALVIVTTILHSLPKSEIIVFELCCKNGLCADVVIR